MTTGSTTPGVLPGLTKHLSQGAGVSVITTDGNPSGIVSPVEPGAASHTGVSGACIAYDNGNDQFYKHIGGTGNADWIKLGSVA